MRTGCWGTGRDQDTQVGTRRAVTWLGVVAAGLDPPWGCWGEPEQRGGLCASRKCPSPRPAPGCYFSVMYTQNSHSTAPTPQHWPHPDPAAVLGDPASRSALWGGWEMGPEMGLQGDRPLFTTFFPFPRVTKALLEPPAPR